MHELVPEKMNIAYRVTESVSDYLGRLSFDKGCSQGFITSLPFMYRTEEVLFITHTNLIHSGVDNVNHKYGKTDILYSATQMVQPAM